MVGTSDQSCWPAEACKIPVWGVSGEALSLRDRRYDRNFIPNAKCKKFATNLKPTFLHDVYH